MAVRRIEWEPRDPDLDALGLGTDSALEVGVARVPLDPAPFEPREVLVVSADPEVLAGAGRLGLQRLVVDGTTAEATAAAVAELVGFLDRG